MKEFECYLPTKIIFGVGKLKKAGQVLSLFGKRALIVSDKAMKSLGFVETLEEILKEAKIDFVEFGGVEPNPASTKVNEIKKSLQGEKIDFVIGLGGGSSIDFAKAMAIVLTHEGDIWDYVYRSGYTPPEVSDKVLPVVSIVTTSGTGSEVTSYAVLTNPDTLEKSAVWSEKIIPKVAIVDPELTLSLPPRLTASTGIDALSHALESYIHINASPYSELVSLESIRLISESLSAAVANGENIEVRSKMAWAATLAGIGITHAGTTLIHGMGQPMGGRFNVPHGESMALCFPVVMRNSWMVNLDKFAKISEAMGVRVEGISKREAARTSVKAVEDLLEDIRLKPTLKEFGITESDFEELANDALGYFSFCTTAHPWKVDKTQIIRMYGELL